jgi:hypothetical protein
MISNFELHDVNFYRFPFLHMIYHIHDYVLLNLCMVGQLISSDELPDNYPVPTLRYPFLTRPDYYPVSSCIRPES